MFNPKEKTKLDQVQIIGENHEAIHLDQAIWGSGFEASALRPKTGNNLKQSTTADADKFRVRIYNVC